MILEIKCLSITFEMEQNNNQVNQLYRYSHEELGLHGKIVKSYLSIVHAGKLNDGKIFDLSLPMLNWVKMQML